MLWLACEIIRGLVAYRRAESLCLRARWLHAICRRTLRIFAVRVDLSGKAPSSGLLVANHLSYLDILLLSSLVPCVFVAKSEVSGWPMFGWFARMAGTIFVNRESRRDAARASEAIRSALREDALVVLFPEGTSSNGAEVLPFKSSLLEGVIGERLPISVAALRYDLPDGDAEAEVCYWGKHTLVPHLLNLMTKRNLNASVTFSPVPNTWRDRKKLAMQLYAEVMQLHASLSPERREELRVRGMFPKALHGFEGAITRSPLTPFRLAHENHHHLRPELRTDRRRAPHDQHVHREAGHALGKSFHRRRSPGHLFAW
jgi:1-acyl-sn-glycerol-3-phosphate acyltransferase